MNRPRLLDLFCGAGGAGMGYHRAGFEVIGVDIHPQPDYPFEFIQGDWAEPLAFLPGLWKRQGRRYAIHASPPCQRYSTMTKKWARQDAHPDLVDPVREALELIGAPFVIENVVGAPLRDPVMLCGTMFGLAGGDWHLRRHRNFETGNGFSLGFPPAVCHHAPGHAMAVYGHPGGSSRRDPNARFGSFAEWKVAMGVDWMAADELAESIPPAYTEWIGTRLLAALEVAA